MAQPSEAPKWAWSNNNRDCGGCDKKLTLPEVRVFTRGRAYCFSCFEQGEWIQGDTDG